MNLILAICRLYIPSRLRTAKLRELYELTARAFEMDTPDIGGKSFEECLRSYAAFTNNAVRDAYLEGRDILEIKDRLFQSGKKFGNGFGKKLFIRGENQAARAIEILYAAIAIDLKCLTDGQVVVSRCFFSEYYDSRTCEIVSTLDSGIVSGLTDGATLAFSRRITEGHEKCVACISYGSQSR